MATDNKKVLLLCKNCGRIKFVGLEDSQEKVMCKFCNFEMVKPPLEYKYF